MPENFCSNAVKMELKLLPADVNAGPELMYRSVSTLKLSLDLELRGFRLQPIGYGVIAVIASCRSWTGIVTAQELEDDAMQLECVVTAWYLHAL
jgi:translation elongation factor EF-1beta